MQYNLLMKIISIVCAVNEEYPIMMHVIPWNQYIPDAFVDSHQFEQWGDHTWLDLLYKFGMALSIWVDPSWKEYFFSTHGDVYIGWIKHDLFIFENTMTHILQLQTDSERSGRTFIEPACIHIQICASLFRIPSVILSALVLLHTTYPKTYIKI